jgi:hypothetical protein
MPAIASLAEASPIPVVFVYVAEAHALDDWPLMSRLGTRTGKPAIVERQHQTNANRLEAAQAFAEMYAPLVKSVTLLVDDLEEGEVFSKTLNPWPARFYLLKDGVFVWGSYFEPDGTIDFAKFSDVVLSQ